MFDIAWSELLLVAIVAIIVIGPKELPAMLRTLGRMLGKLRSTADDFRKQFDEAVKEAGGEDLQREVRSLKQNNPLNSIKKSIEDAGRDAMRDKPAKPKAPDPDVSGDDLGPPPPLPPRDQSSAGPAMPPSGPSAETPVSSPASGEPKGAASPGPDTEKSAVGPDSRLNGEHRAAG
ncbi:MAG: Sec-independent protein translocase protein TatB [Rhodomicrobiaceae bacterium]